MTQVQRYFPHPPHDVWSALVDPASWWGKPDTPPADVTVGSAFTMTTVPVVGTRFNGVFEVEFLDAVPYEHLTLALLAHASTGQSARWTRQVAFREHEGGTLLTVTNRGVNLDDLDERILLRVVKEIQETELYGIAKLLDQPRG
ncbi:SRPBCC family protein [Mycobacteroides salmoniphilum]|uniref:SRPBCC family protein n=1 Tax=Mycobacteroides salmoniphilum TaxID=404941 RepID=UPI00106618D2|nr:SRPBCC domain-containing protein [Mycobacteroides salmoniphilum]